MQLKKSADTVVKLVSGTTGHALYAKGDTVVLGPDTGGPAFHFKVNPENFGVVNVKTGLYVLADGKLSSTPQAWDFSEAGNDLYYLKVAGSDNVLAVSENTPLVTSFSAQPHQAWKMVEV